MDDDGRGLGDLIGAEAALWTLLWLAVIFAAFFFIGAATGVVAVIVALILSGWLAVRAIGANDES